MGARAQDQTKKSPFAVKAPRNKISENISNVLKLSCLRKTAKTQPRQMALSDPGVGSPIPGVGTVTARVNSIARVLTMH